MSVTNKRVVVLLEREYQDLEVHYPRVRLLEAGVRVVLAGPKTGAELKGKYGYPAQAEVAFRDLKADDYDGVIVPGGWAPDYLRRDPAVLKLVSDLDARGKLVAAICHAGWVLVSANVLKGRTATSFSAIKDDMRNAGCEWLDKDVVVDRNLITSRTPDDLPAFCKAILAFLS